MADVFKAFGLARPLLKPGRIVADAILQAQADACVVERVPDVLAGFDGLPRLVCTDGTSANYDLVAMAAGVNSQALTLLDDVSHLTVTGWTVHQIAWNDTTMDTIAYSDGGFGYVGTATITVAVRSA